MPTAKKLPSGSWHCTVFAGYQIVDGKKKRKYESFTCDDPSDRGKKACEKAAADWALDRKERARRKSVDDALRGYIDSKATVLSPSTLVNYKRVRRNYFDDIREQDITKLDRQTIQTWISGLSARYSPKTVRNVWGLFVPAMDMFGVGPFKVTLPRAEDPELYTPSDADVRQLLSYVKDKELRLTIMLAAYGSLRRSEICALTPQDITDTGVTVNKALVQNEYREWVIKVPKTKASTRHADLPLFVLDYAKEMKPGENGRLISCSPQSIERRFQRAIACYGGPHFRLHDLRHYYVSVSHALGIPEEYTMRNGGWKKESRVMREVYRDVLTDIDRENRERLRAHFSIVQNDMQNKKRRTS